MEADETTEAAPILQPRPPNKPRVVSSRPPQDPPPALLFSRPIPPAVDLPDEPSSPHAPVLDSFTFELAGSPKFKMEDAKDYTTGTGDLLDNEVPQADDNFLDDWDSDDEQRPTRIF